MGRSAKVIAPAIFVVGIVAPAIAGIGPRVIVVIVFIVIVPSGVVRLHVFAAVIVDIAVVAIADELILIAVPVPDVAVLVVPVIRRAVIAGVAGIGGPGLGRGYCREK